MAFKSAIQPLCRNCGKPIRKHTLTYWVETDRRYMSGRKVFAEKGSEPTTKDACQRLVNDGTVVSFRYSHSGTHISRFTTWDGESYESGYFCTGRCAQEFAILCALHQDGPQPLVMLRTKAYAEAIEKRRN